MLRSILIKARQQGVCLHQLTHQRSLHTRNKKAMELIAKGWNALQEVDRVIDYTEPTDPRLHPLFRAADMGDPDAQYELGCRLRVENEDVQSDQQAFYYIEKAVDQGHTGAAIAYGSLLLQGAKIPEALTIFNSIRSASTKAKKNAGNFEDPVDMAKEQFEIAANAGCDLGLRWLKKLEDDEKHKESG
ncbi:hypothetical protein AQUCO_00100846v1 [Aquilegia coerulea]|uniref:Uncharacterized protein n=1 Tax=Aquilegia coerulea TaxID=218851 RepID=A0A2G5FCF1_AQUCA|nr:hypothetical protein AQUCO_00100846v1 [Aquilegia coerulea]